MAWAAAGLAVRDPMPDGLVGDQGGEDEIETCGRDRVRRRGEGEKRIDALRDLRRTPPAMSQLAFDPARDWSGVRARGGRYPQAACGLSEPADCWCRGCRGQGIDPAPEPLPRSRRWRPRRNRRRGCRARRRRSHARRLRPARRAVRKALIGMGLAAGAESMGGAFEISAAEIAFRRPFAIERLRRHARAVGARRGAEDARQRSRPAGARRRARSMRRPRSSAATARAAWSSSAIWSGNVSRKAPETRIVTSARGRSRSGCGTISKPVTRVEAWSQVGRTPMSASAWAMSSPPERSVGEAQRSITIRRGQSPSSCRWRRTTSAAARQPSSVAARVGIARGSRVARLRPVGSTSVCPREGEPDGPGTTKRPSRAFSNPSRSPAAQASKLDRGLTEDMQSVADRHLAEIAEMRVEAGQRLVHRHRIVDAAGGGQSARFAHARESRFATSRARPGCSTWAEENSSTSSRRAPASP